MSPEQARCEYEEASMKRLNVQASDREILAAVDEWVKLFAEERYQAAYDYLYHEEGDIWTPELMRTVISNGGSMDPHWTGRTFKVTWSPDDAIGDEPIDEDVLMRYEDEGDEGDRVVGRVIYGLVLDGEPSSVGAVLDIREVDGALVLQLESIHVL
jgi:hypothetical protein